jgi:hypothetical protein
MRQHAAHADAVSGGHRGQRPLPVADLDRRRADLGAERGRDAVSRRHDVRRVEDRPAAELAADGALAGPDERHLVGEVRVELGVAGDLRAADDPHLRGRRGRGRRQQQARDHERQDPSHTHHNPR